MRRIGFDGATLTVQRAMTPEESAALVGIARLAFEQRYPALARGGDWASMLGPERNAWVGTVVAVHNAIMDSPELR